MYLRSSSPRPRSSATVYGSLIIIVLASVVLYIVWCKLYFLEWNCNSLSTPTDYFTFEKHCYVHLVPRPSMRHPPKAINTKIIQSLTSSVPHHQSYPEECYTESGLEDPEPLVMVAVFSTGDRREWRDLYRLYGRGGIAKEHEHLVEFVFVLGKQPRAARIDHEQLLEEQELYGDLVFLDEEENMDEGKTYFFYRWLARRARNGGKKPRFVLKADDDMFLVWPNLLDSLSPHRCSGLVYWGTSLGSCLDGCFTFYMQGMAYALSWPLVEWIGNATIPPKDYTGIEDAKTGQYLRSLPNGLDDLEIIEVGNKLGYYSEHRIPQNSQTIGLHGLKDPLVWTEYSLKILHAWRQDRKEYLWRGPQS